MKKEKNENQLFDNNLVEDNNKTISLDMNLNYEEESKKSKFIQKEMEKKIQEYFDLYNFQTKKSKNFECDLEIFYDDHLNFILTHKNSLSSGYSGLDSGLPWFAYWVLNTFDLFSKNKIEMSKQYKLEFVSYLKNLLNNTGGFSGCTKGFTHIISNYAAILAIVCLDCKEAYDLIDRKLMYNIFMNMKKTSNDGLKDKKNSFLISKNLKMSEMHSNKPGTFQVHHNGESDLRSTYCVIVVAYILNILDDNLVNGIVENIQACQTFEGGLGPDPYSEAHGGYNFCGIATLVLLGKLHEINVDKMIRWLVNKQMTIEGGFQGRTNKLVDSCYSFWQGSVFNMLLEEDKFFSYDSELLYDSLSLQAYILMACQVSTGGILDKPSKRPDLFHLNYGGSGFSLAQRTTSNLNEIKSNDYLDKINNNFVKCSLTYHESNDLADIDPIFCVSREKLVKAVKYFRSLESIN